MSAQFARVSVAGRGQFFTSVFKRTEKWPSRRGDRPARPGVV